MMRFYLFLVLCTRKIVTFASVHYVIIRFFSSKNTTWQKVKIIIYFIICRSEQLLKLKADAPERFELKIIKFKRKMQLPYLVYYFFFISATIKKRKHVAKANTNEKTVNTSN